MSTTFQRLRSRLSKGDFHHTLGRFSIVRKAYSLSCYSQQQFHPHFYRNRLNPRENSFFFGISPQVCAQNICETGVSFGLRLPVPQVEQVYKFACKTPCHEPGFSDEFYADDVQDGQLKNGRYAFRGLVKHPQQCSVVTDLAQDPILLQIVRSYLKYWPSKLTYHLTWSFPLSLPVSEQKQLYPPLNYHYDVAGYNFMTAYFYITDIDATSGAHVMIERSHNKKPLSTLFTSCAAPQLAKQVIEHYGKESERIIEGKAGFGFVQDPSCFHKLLPPLKKRRLLLQIRYS